MQNRECYHVKIKNVGAQILEKRDIEEFCFDSGYKSAQQIWINKFGDPVYRLKDYWGEGADHMIWRISVKEVLR